LHGPAACRGIAVGSDCVFIPVETGAEAMLAGVSAPDGSTCGDP
jgi:hypothetical protein